jgi:hypothetical protein
MPYFRLSAAIAQNVVDVRVRVHDLAPEFQALLAAM